MGKLFVRLTIVLTSIYLILSYYLAQFQGIDILVNVYTLLFEICVVIYCYSEGKYHCRYIKHTALAILLSDTLTRLDYLFNFLSVEAHNLIPIAILFIGISVSIFKSIRHFYQVTKRRNKRG
jgi:hypothetical protein